MYVLTLRLKTEKYQEDILLKRFEICRKIYNKTLAKSLNQLHLMQQSKEYQTVCKSKSKDRNKQFRELNKKYRLTEYDMQGYAYYYYQVYKKNIDSFTVQKIGSTVYIAVSKLMFHKANKVHFKPYNSLVSISGKSNRTGIKFRENALVWNGLKIPVIVKNNDDYAVQALEDKIKLCRIKRERIHDKFVYYLQLVLDGMPPMKVSPTGEIKSSIVQTGDVGIDIGTQTMAISSPSSVQLLELAPEIDSIEKKIRILNRKLDRSRRATNANKYNADGTIKKGNRDKWIKSNHYLKTQALLRDMYRKQHIHRKQSHCRLANEIITLGDNFKVENMNYAGLQKRGIDAKTGNKSKRFGKSIANKAPSLFLSILNNKLLFNNTQLNKINTVKVKASQYNHVTHEYTKKSLSNRWNDFGEFMIQRDLYSAFLIMCVDDDLETINQEKCEEQFSNFKKMHDFEIERIRNSESRRISSMGI